MSTLRTALLSGVRDVPDGAASGPHRRRLLAELERPRDAVAHLGPNWFASVMGTGIVANAAALLPVDAPILKTVAIGFWLLAALLLLVLAVATAAHWIGHGETARGHASNPAMAPFYGAPPMAMLTVGAGALLVGHRVIGMDAAVVVDLVLWTAGTLTGLVACVGIPYLMVTRHELQVEMTSGAWMMPIVPPMVSAATGAALVAHLPAGQAQLTLLLACYALFGVSLIAGLITICLLWARLAFHGVGAAPQVPTLWIALGVLGQSVTAANLLGRVAPGVVPDAYGAALHAFGVVYGMPVWGFAMLWLSLSLAITAKVARRGLPFTLTFWSFTFPVGTCVTGTAELAVNTGADVLTWAAVALFALLVAGWMAAATGTARGAATGRLLLEPPAVPAVPSRVGAAA